jgi:tetratricopeptide (TPR) repeat protein
MRKKGQLHVLIHSLSKAEKRYFKLFCRQSVGHSNYLKLFETIDAQKEYDEAAIRKKFRKEQFSKQLHVTKNYLHQLILKSLRNFHSEISKDSEVKDMLRNIEILFHKELYDHCEAEIKKAKTIAINFELNTSLAELIGWQRKLAQTTHSQQFSYFFDLLAEQEKVIGTIGNTNLHWQNAVRNSFITMSNTKPALFAATTQNATLENAQTLESKVLYYNAIYFTAIRNGLHDKGEKALSDLLTLLQKHPHRIKEDPAIYISSANNLVSFFVFTKQYKKAIELISQSRSLFELAMQHHKRKSLLKQLLRTYNLELEIYRDTRSYEKDPAAVEHIESFIMRHPGKIPADYLLSFWFQLANIHFMRRDYDHALKWINQVLNTRLPNVRTDLQVQARMMNLVIHLEQDNAFVMRYFVDNTRRFIKKVKDAQPFEHILLAFFAKMGQTPKYEHKSRFRELRQQLFPEGNSIIPANILDYIDYKKWIDEKLKR